MLEKLIEVLAALVAAINANTIAIQKSAVTPKAVAKEKTADTPKSEAPAGPTVAEVRDAAVKNIEARGNDNKFVQSLAAKYGVKKISEVPADKYAEVIAALKDPANCKAPAATTDEAI